MESKRFDWDDVHQLRAGLYSDEADKRYWNQQREYFATLTKAFAGSIAEMAEGFSRIGNSLSEVEARCVPMLRKGACKRRNRIRGRQA